MSSVVCSTADMYFGIGMIVGLFLGVALGCFVSAFTRPIYGRMPSYPIQKPPIWKSGPGANGGDE